MSALKSVAGSLISFTLERAGDFDGYPTYSRAGAAHSGHGRRRAYSSTDEALDAAVVAVEIAVAPGFEGDQHELERLLLDGLASTELSEEEFWDSVDRETNSMLAAHQARPHA